MKVYVLILILLLTLDLICCNDFNSIFKNSFFNNRNKNNNKKKTIKDDDDINDKYLTEITRYLDMNANDRRIASRDELISTSLKIISNVIIYFVVIKKFVKFFDDTIIGILKGSNTKMNIPRNITKYIRNNNTEINSYELELCNGIIDPEMIDIQLSSLGGLNDIKNELLEILEETNSYEKYNSLLNPVKGILLYGPPGINTIIIMIIIIILIIILRMWKKCIS